MTQSGKTDVLLPCPFCWRECASAQQNGTSRNTYWSVECDKCFARGPSEGSKRKVIAAWNRRPTAPSGDALTDEEIREIARENLTKTANQREPCGCPKWKRSYECAEAYVEDLLPYEIEIWEERIEHFTAAGYEIRRPSPAHGEGALREALGKLIRAYVGLLAKGYERITALGGSCDPVEVMERGDPALRDARSALASSAGELVQELHELPALSDNTVRQALEEAHKAVKLLEDLTACGSDDDYVSGVQSKITAALTALSAPDGESSLQKAQTTPPGWKLVPIEPTEEMIVAGDEKIVEVLNDHTFALKEPTAAHLAYRAMLSSSPECPGGTDEIEAVAQELERGTMYVIELKDEKTVYVSDEFPGREDADFKAGLVRGGHHFGGKALANYIRYLGKALSASPPAQTGLTIQYKTDEDNGGPNQN